MLSSPNITSLDEPGFAPADLWHFFKKYSALILLLSLCMGALAAASAVFQADRYESRVVIQPSVPKPSGLSSLLSQDDGDRNYIDAILQSRSLRLSTIKDLKLTSDNAFWDQTNSHEHELNETLARLDKTIYVDASENDNITIRCVSKHPELCQQLASYYFDYVKKRLDADNNSQEQELKEIVTQVSKELASTRSVLKSFMENRQFFIAVEKHGELSATELSELRKLSADARVKLNGLEERLDAPGNIADIMELNADRVGTLGEIESIDQAIADKEAELTGLPRDWEDYTTIVQDLQVKQSSLTAVAAEYELIRLRTQQDKTKYRVIDSPDLGPIKLRRQGALFTILGAVFGGFLGILVATIKDIRRSEGVRELGSA